MKIHQRYAWLTLLIITCLSVTFNVFLIWDRMSIMQYQNKSTLKTEQIHYDVQTGENIVTTDKGVVLSTLNGASSSSNGPLSILEEMTSPQSLMQTPKVGKAYATRAELLNSPLRSRAINISLSNKDNMARATPIHPIYTVSSDANLSINSSEPLQNDTAKPSEISTQSLVLEEQIQLTLTQASHGPGGKCQGCFNWIRQFTLTPQAGICNTSSPYLIIMVSSKMGDTSIARRGIIRDTWGSYAKQSMGMYLVFILGSEGDPSHQKQMQEESARHGDILQVDIAGNDPHSPFITFNAFRWAEENCPRAGFVGKVRDNVYLYIPGIMKVLKDSGPSQLMDVVFGQCYGNLAVPRDYKSPLYSRHDQYPYEKYPNFCVNSAMLLSMKMLTKVLPHLTNVRYHAQYDDILLGTVAKFEGFCTCEIPGFYFHRYSEKLYQRLLPFLETQTDCPIFSGKQSVLGFEMHSDEDLGKMAKIWEREHCFKQNIPRPDDISCPRRYQCTENYYNTEIDTTNIKVKMPLGRCQGCMHWKHPYLITPANDLCLSDEEPKKLFDLIVLATAQHENRKRRDILRRTWGSYAMDSEQFWLIFVFGRHPGGNQTLEQELQEEAVRYGDVLQVDIHGTYRNTTRMVFNAHNWILTQCPKTRFVGKISDDLYLNVPAMLRLLRYKDGPANELNEVVFGDCQPGGTVVVRRPDDSWYQSWKSYPYSFYPSYCSGAGTFLSFDLLKQLIPELSNVRYELVHDDVTLGILLRLTNYCPCSVLGFNFFNYAGPELAKWVTNATDPHCSTFRSNAPAILGLHMHGVKSEVIEYFWNYQKCFEQRAPQPWSIQCPKRYQCPENFYYLGKDYGAAPNVEPFHARPHRERVAWAVPRRSPPAARPASLDGRCESCFKWKSQFLIRPALSCSVGNPELDLVLLVSSEISNVQNRDVIRRTWGSYAKSAERLGVLFVFGSPTQAGNASINAQLMIENDKHGDILEVGLGAGHLNKTTVFWNAFRWTEENCAKAKFVAMASDDVYLNVPGILKLLKEHQVNELGDVLFGHCYMNGAYPVRHQRSQWFQPWQTYPFRKYPSYCSSAGAFLSMSLLKSLLTEVANVRYPVVHPDVMLGITIRMTENCPCNIPGFMLFDPSTQLIDQLERSLFNRSGPNCSIFENVGIVFAINLLGRDVRTIETLWKLQHCFDNKVLWPDTEAIRCSRQGHCPENYYMTKPKQKVGYFKLMPNISQEDEKDKAIYMPT